MKDNFDALPYLDDAADFILKAVEEGNLLIHGYRDESRGPSCLMAFLMKFFGWDYQRCFKTILKKRPMARFTKTHDKAIAAYHGELNRLKICIERGQFAESDLVSNFTSSMKPFFLRAVVKHQAPKVTESQGIACCGAQKTEENHEFVGGENITPRENNFLNETGMSYDPIPYKKLAYSGTDEFVRAKLENRSQGIPQIKKAQSMIRLRKDMNAEEVIGSYQEKSRYGKGFRVRESDMMRSRTQGKFYGQQNLYDPSEEPALQPERDFEEESQNSMRSSKAMSYNSKMSKQRRDIRNSIQEALDSSKPKWVTKSINNPQADMITTHVSLPQNFAKKNLRNNPVYREIGLDRLVDRNDYGNTKLQDIYQSSGIFNKSRLHFTNMEVPTNQQWKGNDMNKSGFKYTNTCVMIKGSNPFVVSNQNKQPPFQKTQTSFNFRARPGFIDQNGNTNKDWADLASGRMASNPACGALCAFCHTKLIDAKDVNPHSYAKPVISQAGDLQFFSDGYEKDSEYDQQNRVIKSHGRNASSSGMQKDFKHPEDFYNCTGVFVKMKEYMRFDTSSNGGQILCPNAACKRHLGQAKMSGTRCGCGFYQVPGYFLWKMRIVVKAK